MLLNQVVDQLMFQKVTEYANSYKLTPFLTVLLQCAYLLQNANFKDSEKFAGPAVHQTTERKKLPKAIFSCDWYVALPLT